MVLAPVDVLQLGQLGDGQLVADTAAQLGRGRGVGVATRHPALEGLQLVRHALEPLQRQPRAVAALEVAVVTAADLVCRRTPAVVNPPRGEDYVNKNIISDKCYYRWLRPHRSWGKVS